MFGTSDRKVSNGMGNTKKVTMNVKKLRPKRANPTPTPDALVEIEEERAAMDSEPEEMCGGEMNDDEEESEDDGVFLNESEMMTLLNHVTQAAQRQTNSGGLIIVLTPFDTFMDAISP